MSEQHESPVFNPIETNYTTRAVAGFLQTNVRRVRSWIKSGGLKAMRISGEYRIFKSDLLHFVEIAKNTNANSLTKRESK